jgi:HAD superfamily hydrolase (TIGR01509 family)
MGSKHLFENVQLIIYDLDGVLIDSNEAILKSFKLTFDEIGLKFDPNDIIKRLGWDLIYILKEILPDEHKGKEWELRERYIHHFQKLDIKHTFLLPGVKETLINMNLNGYRQSVATNKTGMEAERILVELGVRNQLDLIVGFLDVPNPKPAPDMILYTLDKLGTRKESTILLDDTTVGLTAGIRAGVKTIGITTGVHDRTTLRSVGPHHIIDDITQLTSLLK